MRIIRPSTLAFSLAVGSMVGGTVAVVASRVVPGGAWLGAVVVAAVVLLGTRRALRRWYLARQSFPAAWRDWLLRHVPPYARMDDGARGHFECNIRFVLDEHRFEGVEGAEVTDALRLGVAAGAALLLHGRPDWELPGRRTVLFYPDRFDDDYFPGEEADYDGMVHPQGPILFSAPAVLESWADPDDGDNVVIHELVHLFDFDNFTADGVPSLMDPSSATAWQTLVRKEMARVRRGRSVLDSYAGSSPAEFLAVAAENFFERPQLLQRRHRRLYEALTAFFNYDPLAPDAPIGAATDPAPQDAPEAAGDG